MEETTRVGIYARLSRDDERFGESMSIENQKLMLTDYCDRQGWEIIDIYADDGFTGLTFDRPEMQRLIEDAKNGRINTVLVKDLSRFGRNYVEAGQLIDDLFPLLNIRLVAPNDGVDTHTNQNTDFIPIRNVFNEYYCKDISRKVISARKASAKQGNFMGSSAPYGYWLDPNDRHKLIIDEDAAVVVQRIFQMRADDCSYNQIADAIRLGYDNSDRWRELVKRQIPVIAEQSRIPMSNLKWYAAFHDTTHHPHIHLIVYSTNPKQGYLSREGIDKIRSAFANDIFHDDLQSIYQEQTLSRDELKSISQEQVHQMVMKIQQSEFYNPQLEKLVRKLHEQLQTISGKKIYGYLPQNVKRTVDDILTELAKDKQVSQLYEKWCKLERLKYKIYTEKELELPSLADNKVFKPVKNMIIRAVLDMSMPELSPYSVPQNDDSDDTAFSDIDNDVFTWNDEDAVEIEVGSTNLHIQWSKDYKRACKLYYKKDASDDEKKEAVELLHSEAEKGNVLAIHDLGKVYADDNEKSDAYYKQALDGFLKLEPMSQKLQPYLQYRIGKMYCYGSGTEQNYAKSFGWFLKSAFAGNKFAQFSLANQYYYGNGFYKDKQQALQWHMKSAEQGLPYAAYAVAQMYANGEEVLQDEAAAQRYYAQALAGFLKLEESDRADDNLLYKLGRMYRYGLGTDEDIPKALEYFARSAKHGNINARRMIAIEQLSGEHIPMNVNKAVEALTELAENGDVVSAYMLGKIYLFGALGIERDVPQAIQWLTQSAEGSNEYAQQLLDNMEQREDAAFASTIFGLFVSLSHAIEDDYNKSDKKLQFKVDSKLRRVILKRKQELGINPENGQTQTF